MYGFVLLAAADPFMLIEALESRTLCYAVSGLRWANPTITYSVMPDGTKLTDTASSVLYAELKAYSPAAWQAEFARAMNTWAQYANITVKQVPDDGSPRNSWGLVQGDPRFGDIRLGARDLSDGVIAGTYYPSAKGSVQGGTDPGEITLNTDYTFRLGSTYDLYSILLHETGHALGLAHSTSGTVMYAYAPTGVYAGLSADDIAGIQAIYGAKPGAPVPEPDPTPAPEPTPKPKHHGKPARLAEVRNDVLMGAKKHDRQVPCEPLTCSKVSR